MNALENTLLKHTFSKVLNEQSINLNNVEAFINFPLPEDYKYYLSNFLAFEGFIGSEYFCLWSKDELIELNNEYSIVSLPQTLGIGSNGAGEFIAIVALEGGKYSIVLSPFVDLNSQYHIKIGNSFTDFISRLDKGQEWFDDTE
jgi:hypothetical protein